MMLVLWINVFPRHHYPEAVATMWSRNFASFCFQAWLGRDRILSAHLTMMLRTYLKAEEQAWIVRGASYELLNGYDHPAFHGIVNQRFDPWHNRD